MIWVAVIIAARLALLGLIHEGARLRIPFPPLDARLDWRPGWPLLLPVALGIAVVVGAPSHVARARWSYLLVTATVVAAAWAVALALLDGADGLVHSVTLKTEYFLDVGRVGNPLHFLQAFTTNLAHYRVHVQGHPPGYLLILWFLSRIGVGTPSMVAAIEIAGGALAVPAVLIALREVAGEAAARDAAPFVAVAPVAIWVASSADAFFAGVGAWAVTLLVLASGRTGRRANVLAVAGGLLVSGVAFLSYGLALIAIIPVAILARRRRGQLLILAGVSSAFVVVAFALAGFWWFDGLVATHARYYAGVASHRPYGPFLLADLACLAIILGPALAVALARLRDRRQWWIVGSAIVAIGVAAISGMSKGEVERIWLPFAFWILPAGAVLWASSRRRSWLALQVLFTIFLQTLVRSSW